MRTHRRMVLALVLAAGLLGPAVPASADWSCTYYKWEEGTRTWKRLVLMYPSGSFEKAYTYGVDWHCKYNCVPTLIRQDDPIGPALEALGQHVTAPGVDPPSASPVDPWDGPTCPPVAPEWDNKELNDALKP